MNIGDSPLKSVFLNMTPIKIASAIPITYRDHNTVPACVGKKAPIKTTYTGSLAPQDISGISSAARAFSRVRVA